MTIYRVSYALDGDLHTGYTYHSSRKDAEKDAKESTEFHTTEIEKLVLTPTKAGIIRFLNIYGDHPDNG